MPPSHLNLARRKALAARIAVSINLEASPLPVFDDKDESQGTRILKMAFSNADYAAEMLDERLDKALKKVADNLGYIFQHNNASSADAVHGKIDSLLTHLRAYDCEKCKVLPIVKTKTSPN